MGIGFKINYVGSGSYLHSHANPLQRCRRRSPFLQSIFPSVWSPRNHRFTPLNRWQIPQMHQLISFFTFTITVRSWFGTKKSPIQFVSPCLLVTIRVAHREGVLFHETQAEIVIQRSPRSPKKISSCNLSLITFNENFDRWIPTMLLQTQIT